MTKWTKKRVDEKEYKLSVETAEAYVREFLDYFDTGIPENASEETEKNADTFFQRLVDAYRRGKIENSIDETTGFTITQHIEGRDDIKYREMKVKDRAVMERYGEDQAESRAIALMGKLSGYGEDMIKSMDAPDYRVCMALAAMYFLV